MQATVFWLSTDEHILVSTPRGNFAFDAAAGKTKIPAGQRLAVFLSILEKAGILAALWGNFWGTFCHRLRSYLRVTTFHAADLGFCATKVLLTPWNTLDKTCRTRLSLVHTNHVAGW